MFGRNTEQLNRELELLLGGENQQVARQTGRNLRQQFTAPNPVKPNAPGQPTAQSQAAPKLPNLPNQAVKNPVPAMPRQSNDPKLRVSKEDWDKYHQAWQNYYKNYYAEMAQKEGGPKKAFEENLRREILAEAYKKPASLVKKLFSRKVLPFTIGILAVLILCFLQYNRNIIGFFATFIAPSHGDIALAEIPDATIGTAISADSKLYIPKINVSVPVVFGAANDVDSQNKAMENGVAQFAIPGANALPGQVGNLAISGHSSNDLFDSGDYKFIFARLERLDNGDTIYLDYNGTRYVYKVTRKEEVLPAESNKLIFPTDRPFLTLITCTPVGTALRRLLVFAEQISPAPTAAEQPTGEASQDNADYEMPANSPTLFERIKALFTL